MSNTTSKIIRFPNWLLEEYQLIKKEFPTLTFSSFVVYGASKEINRLKGVKNVKNN